MGNILLFSDLFLEFMQMVSVLVWSFGSKVLFYQSNGPDEDKDSQNPLKSSCKDKPDQNRNVIVHTALC